VAAALTFDLLLLSSSKGNYFTAQLILQFICAHYAKEVGVGLVYIAGRIDVDTHTCPGP